MWSLIESCHSQFESSSRSYSTHHHQLFSFRVWLDSACWNTRSCLADCDYLCDSRQEAFVFVRIAENFVPWTAWIIDDQSYDSSIVWENSQSSRSFWVWHTCWSYQVAQYNHESLAFARPWGLCWCWHECFWNRLLFIFFARYEPRPRKLEQQLHN